jgi:hypothetical protein
MKPILAAAAAALLVSGAALAQTSTTPRGTVQSQPPAVDTGSQGYQGQGGSSATSTGMSSDTGTTHRQSGHHKRSTHAKTHHGTRHPSTATANPTGTSVGSDATQSGTATAPTNGGR